MENPIEIIEDSAFINPELMDINEAYKFEYLGVELFAMKRIDGIIDIFQEQEAPDEQG